MIFFMSLHIMHACTKVNGPSSHMVLEANISKKSCVFYNFPFYNNG